MSADAGGHAVGVDVGGTAIKVALVDVTRGILQGQAIRLPTPSMPTLPSVVEAIGEAVERSGLSGSAYSIGVAFPAIVRAGRYSEGPGLFADWAGADASSLIASRLGQPVSLINDADAAGMAEVRFGQPFPTGTVIVLTLGTFIGSALFHERRLVPNTELGQLEFKGSPAETQLGGRAKLTLGLSWKAWAYRFNAYLSYLASCFSPEAIVLTGGMTHEAATFLPFIESAVPLRVSAFVGDAGIVGAAMVACL